MSSEPLVIASRFCGPPGSGNGGYVCGRVAAHLPGVVSVRLKSPPPLETELQVEKSESAVQLLHGQKVIAEAKTVDLDLAPPACPSFAAAEAAAKFYAGFTRHPFPTCFVCGTQRALGDGLRVFPGPLASQSMIAAPWTPDASLGHGDRSVRIEYLWAALDCPGAFAVMPVAAGRALVLGELCVRVDASVEVGEPCIVTAWPIQTDGRKRIAGSALHSASGRVLAVGRATWIEVPVSAFGGRDSGDADRSVTR
jgi:hypothetical protein